MKLEALDLVWEAPAIDEYEATFASAPPGFWSEMLDIGFVRQRFDV